MTAAAAGPLTPEQWELVVGHLALVHHVIRRRFGPATLARWYDDMASDGTLGLIRAARTYDPSRGPFRAYAPGFIWKYAAEGLERMRIMALRRAGGETGRAREAARRVREGVVERVRPDLQAGSGDPGFVAVDSADAVERMLAALSPRRREAVELWLAGSHAAEISRALGITPESARDRLRGAFRQLAAEQEGVSP